MIEPNNKPLEKPYCLHRVEFSKQLYSWANDRAINGSLNNFSEYVTILDNKGMKQFKPEMWQALLPYH